MEEDDYERARRAFAELGFDIDVDSVESQSRRLGLPPPNPNDPTAGWAAFVTAATRGAPEDPWADGLDPAAWRSAIPVEFVGAFDLDPFDLAAELTVSAEPGMLVAIAGVLRSTFPAVGNDEDGHISYSSDVSRVRLPPAAHGVAWWIDAASAGPRTIERYIDAVTRGMSDAGIPVTRLIVGHRE